MRQEQVIERNPFDAFGGVYILNLPERTGRLADTRAELARLHANAVEETKVFPGTRATEAHGFPSVGAYGCFQGHLGILRQARDLDLSSVLVLEDDVTFDVQQWVRDWPSIEAELHDRAWDVVNLGFDGDAIAQGNGRSRLVQVSEPLMLAHCYAVHRRSIGPLVEFLEAIMQRSPGDPLGGPMHFDGALFHFCRDIGGVLRFRPERSLAGQRSSRSDIAEPRWFDRKMTGTRGLVEWMRARRNRFRSRIFN